MNILVGYTGFVGSNIYVKGSFDAVFNSKNISEAYGTNPDLLVYAGLRAEKYIANANPEKDMELIHQAIHNIKCINPQNIVLISTIDIFKEPINVDETSEIDTEGLGAYGYNRYQLELWVRKNYPNALIVRLPGLYGKNIKKNFIFDFIERIPKVLKKEKLNELLAIEPAIAEYYEAREDGFYSCKNLTKEEKVIVKKLFEKTGFSALNFTDSRNVYQFYPLNRLWQDIEIALKNDIKIFHPATEPVETGELYKYLVSEEFVNHLNVVPVRYDYRTAYDEKFGGTNGYICDKETVMKGIRDFVNDETKIALKV